MIEWINVEINQIRKSNFELQFVHLNNFSWADWEIPHAQCATTEDRRAGKRVHSLCFGLFETKHGHTASSNFHLIQRSLEQLKLQWEKKWNGKEWGNYFSCLLPVLVSLGLKLKTYFLTFPNGQRVYRMHRRRLTTTTTAERNMLQKHFIKHFRTCRFFIHRRG